MLTCYLNGVMVCPHVLDSGAQVTTLEDSWLEKHLPDAR